MRRVKIKNMPNGKPVTTGTKARFPNNKSFWPGNFPEPGDLSVPDFTVRKTLQPVPRDEANLEAEKGETVFGDINNDTLPEHYTIGGKKHSQGGTPLNLPDNAFIFSDDKKLKIKEPAFLTEFNKNSKKGYTPAKIAKQYDINEYRKLLQNPDADELTKKTSENMIANYNMKLGKLALVQESKKGFPQGIPQVAIPYMDKNKIDPEFLVQGKEYRPSNPMPQAKQGMEVFRKLQKRNGKFYQLGGAYDVPGYNDEPVNPFYTIDPEDMPPIQLSPQEMDALLYNHNQQVPDSYYQNPGQNQALAQQTSNAPQAYTQMELMLKDPKNESLRDAIYKDYLKKRPGSKLPKDQVIDNFLTAQKQIYTIQAAKVSNPEALSDQKWDKGGKEKNKVYKETASSLGLTPLDENQIKDFQAVYQSMYDLSSDPEFKPLLGNIAFGVNASGVGDEPVYGKDQSKQISPIDGIFGNTTVGQLAGVRPSVADKVIQDPTNPVVAKDDYTQPAIEEKNAYAPSQWWLQDITKTAGAATDMARIKKYMPWGAPIQPYIPDTTFYDPTRELAANAEQANIGVTGVGMFAGPRALSSRASSIQGTAAQNTADIMSRYNNLNVGAANQAEAQKSEILNNAAMQNKGNAQDLYDKTQFVNQNFDNAKAMARQQLRSSYIDAITNKAQTQVMNQLYPQYNISPITGGNMVFTKGKDLKAGYFGENDLSQHIQTILHNNPNITPELAYKIATGQPANLPTDAPDPEYLRQYMQLLQGQ